MDAGLLAVIAVAVVVGGALLWLRPAKVQPLGELLDTLAKIEADPEETLVQKRATSAAVYESYRKHKISVVGRVEDVFPNGSAVIETPLRQLPFLGFDFVKISQPQLHKFTKGRSMSLRAKLDTWEKYRAANNIIEVLLDARVFCDKRWYPVKNLYIAGSSGGSTAAQTGGAA